MVQRCGSMIYRLKARLLCHDVRLNSWVETAVALEEEPSPVEAERLLWPAADVLVAKNGCEGCPYELSAVSVVLELGEV
jgi:hypothetical protein